jgi:hypothetical protein
METSHDEALVGLMDFLHNSLELLRDSPSIEQALPQLSLLLRPLGSAFSNSLQYTMNYERYFAYEMARGLRDVTRDSGVEFGRHRGGKGSHPRSECRGNLLHILDDVSDVLFVLLCRLHHLSRACVTRKELGVPERCRYSRTRRRRRPLDPIAAIHRSTSLPD